MEQQELIDKIKRLPQDRVAEVAEFVESLGRDHDSGARAKLHTELTNYARQYAGSIADIDPDLATAATDHLLQPDPDQ